MNQFSDKLALVIMTLWVGGLWAIGYLAAPALFYHLQDHQLAGNLAGEMFKLVAYLGFISGLYLLIHRLSKFGTKALKQGFFWTVFIMLVLTLAGHFGIAPVIAQLKAQALPADVMHSVFADRFSTWHGVASIAYLIQSLLGLVLIFKSTR
jgi:predicted cobalt transporter CbtA